MLAIVQARPNTNASDFASLEVASVTKIHLIDFADAPTSLDIKSPLVRHAFQRHSGNKKAKRS